MWRHSTSSIWLKSFPVLAAQMIIVALCIVDSIHWIGWTLFPSTRKYPLLSACPNDHCRVMHRGLGGGWASLIGGLSFQVQESTHLWAHKEAMCNKSTLRHQGRLWIKQQRTNLKSNYKRHPFHPAIYSIYYIYLKSLLLSLEVATSRFQSITSHLCVCKRMLHWSNQVWLIWPGYQWSSTIMLSVLSSAPCRLSLRYANASLI